MLFRILSLVPSQFNELVDSAHYELPDKTTIDIGFESLSIPDQLFTTFVHHYHHHHFIFCINFISLSQEMLSMD